MNVSEGQGPAQDIFAWMQEKHKKSKKDKKLKEERKAAKKFLKESKTKQEADGMQSTFISLSCMTLSL